MKKRRMGNRLVNTKEIFQGARCEPIIIMNFMDQGANNILGLMVGPCKASPSRV